MIKISFLSPINKFVKQTWEFYEDRLVVKAKSITFDYKTEVNYEKIKIIRNRKAKDTSWVWASFITASVLGAINLILSYFSLMNSTLIIVEKVAGVLMLLLLIPAFRTIELYSFLDGDKKYLATVVGNEKNKKSILEAIELIKQKTEISNEIYVNDPLPSTSPVFQISEFDFPDFLNKVNVNFYGDRIIARQKSLTEEITTVIKYDEFSGKVQTSREGNENWDTAWSYWLFFVCITGISILVFFPEQIYGNTTALWLFLGALFLIVPMYLLKFIKSEIMMFYDKKDHGIFWLEINSANSEKINQIVSFVQEKVVLKK